MSEYFLGTIKHALRSEQEDLRRFFRERVEQWGWGISWGIDWDNEPLMEHIDPKALLFNLTDDPVCGVCDFLILKDGWSFDGEENEIPFLDRMRRIADIVDMLLKRYATITVEFYIACSGTPYDELLPVFSTTREFPQNMKKWFDAEPYDYPDLHITFVREV